METKEMSYNELVINGFMALFFNLVMLPALVFLNFLIFWATTLVIYSCFVYAGIVVCADASRIFFSRT